MKQKDNISQPFNERNEPRQVMTQEEIKKVSPAMQDIMQGIVTYVMDTCDIEEGRVGEPKSEERVDSKSKEKFEGDVTYITDFHRATLVTDDYEQLEYAKICLETPDSEIRKKFGIIAIDKDDNYETPKEYTRYRGLQYKLLLETPVGKPQWVELQVVSSIMDKVYDLTHPHKRAAENIYAKATAENRALTDEEHTKAGQHLAVCQYYNSKVAHEGGLDEFLLDKETYAFTPELAKALKERMAGLFDEKQDQEKFLSCNDDKEILQKIRTLEV